MKDHPIDLHAPRQGREGFLRREKERGRGRPDGSVSFEWKLVDLVGIEPTTSPASRGAPSFQRFESIKIWWTWSGSNRRPLPCHGSALPAAPQAHDWRDNSSIVVAYGLFVKRQATRRIGDRGRSARAQLEHSCARAPSRPVPTPRAPQESTRKSGIPRQSGRESARKDRTTRPSVHAGRSGCRCQRRC